MKATWWPSRYTEIVGLSEAERELAARQVCEASRTIAVEVDIDQALAQLFVENVSNSRRLLIGFPLISKAKYKESKPNRSTSVLNKQTFRFQLILDNHTCVFSFTNSEPSHYSRFSRLFARISQGVALEEERRVAGKQKRLSLRAFYGVGADKQVGAPAPKNVRYFPRQAQAFQWMDEMDDETFLRFSEGHSKPICISVEHAKTGRRQFVVAGRQTLFDIMLQARPLNRHFYEIIREKRPCRLYFDVEFAIPSNPELDGGQLVRKLIDCVAYEMYVRFNRRVCRRQIIQLGSTTDVKFSQHLIFQGDWLFRSNTDCGRFVRFIADKYSKHFLVNNKNSDNVVNFIDTGVYTRNRMFRMFLSCKYGKTAILEPTEDSTYPYCDESKDSLFCFFQESLVCPADTIGMVLLDVSSIPEPEKSHFNRPMRRQRSSAACEHTRHDYESSLPFLDRFILNWVAKGGGALSGAYPHQIGIRSSYFTVSRKELLLTYNIVGNRYCYNIMRQHKSNHVYYVVNLSRLVFDQVCFMKPQTLLLLPSLTPSPFPSVATTRLVQASVVRSGTYRGQHSLQISLW